MLSSSTIALLKQLNRKEFGRLGDFIKSPYLNSIVKLEELYDILAKEYPVFDESNLEHKKVFQKLYPGKAYKEKTVKNLYSEFSKALKKFLALEEISQDHNLLDLKLAIALSSREALDASGKIISNKEKKINYKELGKEYYRLIYDLENQKYLNLFKEKKFNLQDIYFRLFAVQENLIGFFLSEFCNTGFNMLFSIQTQNIDPGNRKLIDFIMSFDTQKLLHYLDSSNIQNPVVVKIYYLFLYYLVNDFTEDDFYKLKEMITSNAQSFTKEDLMHFWGNIMNIVILKLVPADKKFYHEIYELSRFFCKLKIYPDDSIDKFPLSIFRNIIFSSMYVEEFKWTEQFIDEYGNFLEDDKKEYEINYNKGMLYFHYKKYNESLAYLSKVNFTDIYENVNVRFYYVMNFIELKFYDSALSSLQAIRQLYKTNKNIPDMIIPYIKDSIRFFSEIIKCLENDTKVDYPVYKRAYKTGRFFMKKYVVSKMEKLI